MAVVPEMEHWTVLLWCRRRRLSVALPLLPLLVLLLLVVVRTTWALLATAMMRMCWMLMC
jgi:hypothetical protein